MCIDPLVWCNQLDEAFLSGLLTLMASPGFNGWPKSPLWVRVSGVLNSSTSLLKNDDNNDDQHNGNTPARWLSFICPVCFSSLPHMFNFSGNQILVIRSSPLNLFLTRI